MDGGFNSTRLVGEIEDSENSPENSGDTRGSAAFNHEFKVASTFTKRRKRAAMEKRVISIPIKDEAAGFNHETNAPPSDSWTWRKYGQKPIKGSPYPRGYYRCSSSKGCPAKKQVERCRTDPNTVVVAYSREHNHPTPSSRKKNRRTATTTSSSSAAAAADITTSSSKEYQKKPAEIVSEDKFGNIYQGPLINGGAFELLPVFVSTSSCTILESPLLTGELRMETDDDCDNDDEMAMIFATREEAEYSLFADLEELPECSTVFRHDRGGAAKVLYG